MLIIVDTQHIRIEPHFSSSKCRMAFLLERDRLDIIFGEHITSCCSRLDRQFTEVFVDLQFLQMHSRLEQDAYDFCFSIGVRRKINYFRARFALCEVILLIFCHTSNIEAFHEVSTLFSIPVNHIINGSIISSCKDSYMQNIRTHEKFLCHTHYFILAILMENDDIVYIRAIEQELIFLQSRAHKTFRTIDIEFLVILNHRLDIDSPKIAHLCSTRIEVSIFSFEHLKPLNGIVVEMFEILDTSLDFPI